MRVCAPVTFARLHIVPRLSDFLDAHPNLRLEIVMDDRNVDLLEESIDVAFRLGDLADSGLTARKIARNERVVVASPGYVAQHGNPQSPADLLAHRAVVYGQQAGMNEWRFWKGNSETSVTVPSRLILTAAEGVREAVLTGLGIAMSSRWMFARELAAGDVVPLLGKWTLPPIDLWALFPAGRLPSTKARAFVSWFENNFS